MEARQDGRIALGRLGEEAAVRYLRRSGRSILARGFRMLRGEIDIVAREGGTIVFAEVKTRRGSLFGNPAEAVTPAKQAQIRRIAEGYLAKNRLGGLPCRFDVISVIVEDGRVRIAEHIRDAF